MSDKGTRSHAVTSGLDILETLAASPAGMGVSEVARRLGADKGNTHRSMQVLVERGYVEQDAHTRLYTMSPRVLSLARSVLRGLDIVHVARPEMNRLAIEVGESVHLALKTRTGGVYVAIVRQPGRVSVETEIGAAPVIHATATGKALYCLSPDDELDRVLEQPLTIPRTGETLTRETLRADLEASAARGYALDLAELTPDVHCVAVPIFDIYTDVVASIGISGPSSRMTPERMSELGSRVGLTAANITQQLGGRIPTRFNAHPTSLMEVHK